MASNRRPRPRRFRVLLVEGRGPLKRSRTARGAIAAVALAVVVGVAVAVAMSSSSRHSHVVAAASTCARDATPDSFGSVVSASHPGETICLASGDYGTWKGTDKTITVAAAAGSAPRMRISFASGARGFTLDGIGELGGTIGDGAADIVIRRSTFAAPIDIVGAVSGIVLDRDRFDWAAVSIPHGPNAKIFVDVRGTLAAPAVTIERSDIENGDLDGVHVGGGSGLVIRGNTFKNLCDRRVNHTDNIQFEGGTQIVVAGNYIHEAHSCATQGITSYDGGTNGLIIEDNVVDVPRDWGIELYSDQKSIVRHNTVVYHPKAYSAFHSGSGQIAIDRKPGDAAGSGTEVYDNIATSVGFANGSTGNARDNVSGERAVYAGPPTSWSAFKLRPDSPVGVKAASDGLNVGARIP
jgi:Right handed beta helix region